MIGTLKLGSSALVLLFFASVPASAESWKPSGWDKPLHGVTFDLPRLWWLEDSDDPQIVDITCHTPECVSTQETCRFIVTDEPIPDGLIPGAWLVSLSLGQRETRKEVLESSHEGARITREPGISWIGTQSWYVTETLAASGWKSLYQATTVIDGRFIRVQCRTCDRAEERFDFAERILLSLAVEP